MTRGTPRLLRQGVRADMGPAGMPALQGFSSEEGISSRKKPAARQRGLLLASLLMLLLGTVLGQSARRFHSEDPMAVEPETQDASRVVPFKIDLFYDLLLNQFSRPGEPA
ncbi:MAG TPA: hypothetical protein VHP35_06575, partial [Terriglobia bacterium]|nr:hypothetical protein [Terriglobia bacterium]